MPDAADVTEFSALDLHAPLSHEQLVGLFLAGLTYADIGALHGLDGSRIGQLARQWRIDSRALRATSRSLARLRPDLALEFHADAAGRTPKRGPENLTLGSGAHVAWRCGGCGHIWRTSVANRALRGSGCPMCARERARDESLRTRARTPGLSYARPELAREFVRNLSVPERDVYATPAGSHDRILWRCAAGHEWTTVARQRVKHRTHCPTCRGGLHRSRLEYEVAELLMAATGLHVTVGHEEPRTDRSGMEKVDLRIDALALLVDLDSSRWHRAGTAVDRDRRKLDRLADVRRYVRVRPLTLGPLLDMSGQILPGQVLVDASPETDAWPWAVAILRAVSGDLPERRGDWSLSPAARAAALGRASRRWSALNRHDKRPSLLSEHPHVAAEFVAVPDRSGLTAADLAPAGDDRVRWRCSTCGHEWTARTANRTLLGTGCPPCSYRAAGRLTARPTPGNSFADRHPGLTKHFIDNLTHPGVGPTQLRPNSTDRCRWHCPHCGRLWVNTPHALNRRPDSGCRRCCSPRISAARRARAAAAAAEPV